MTDKLYIKSMVCDRCISAVKQELEKLKIDANSVSLGEVTLKNSISSSQLVALQIQLNLLGFEVIDDKKTQFVQRIKNAIIELIHHNNSRKSISSYSRYLSELLNKDYSFISSVFSELEGITIERYVIHQKIEKVKELLTYNEKNISEIADELEYSSVGHLSNQFKKITSMSPSQFKTMVDNTRLPLDKV